MARIRRHLWFHAPRGRRQAAPGDRPRQTWSWRGLGELPQHLTGSTQLVVQDPAGDVALGLVARGFTVEAHGGPVLALKATAVAHLPVQSAQALLGLDAAGRRVWFLHYLSDHLDEASQAWWRTQEPWVREGLCTAGRLEQAAARFRRIGLAGLGLHEPHRLAAALSGRRGRLRWATLDPAAAPALQRRLVPCLKTLPDDSAVRQLLTGEPPSWLTRDYAAVSAAAAAGRLRVHTDHPAGPITVQAGPTRWGAPTTDSRYEDAWVPVAPA